MAVAADRIHGIDIDLEDLVQVRNHLSGMTLNTIRRRSSYRSGARETRLRGRGMEYEESRAYVPGDDMRTMDWRVMARTGEAHTKIFAEEKERRFLLALDLSASMFFGTHYSFKSWAAAQTAAHVGWLASFAGDRLGGLIAAPEAHYEVRPGKTRAGLMGVFHYLVEALDAGRGRAGSAGRLNFLLRELQRVTRPGSVIALISDFIGVDDGTPELISALVRHNDVNAFWIHDQTEVDPWPHGRYPVLLPDGRVELEIGQGESAVSRCQQAHRERIERLATRFNLPLFALSCNRDISLQIAQVLKL